MAAVVVVALALAVLALRSVTVEETVIDTFNYDPAVHGTASAFVVSKSASGGFSIFGIRIDQPDRRVSVQFVAPGGCSDAVRTGDPWPPAVDGCATPFPVTGTIAGLGRNPDGTSLVGVDVDVTKACYEATALGTTWPSTIPACSG